MVGDHHKAPSRVGPQDDIVRVLYHVTATIAINMDIASGTAGPELESQRLYHSLSAETSRVRVADSSSIRDPSKQLSLLSIAIPRSSTVVS